MNERNEDIAASFKALTTVDVLRREFVELWGASHERRIYEASSPDADDHLRRLRAAAFESGQAALCLSGGGLRSASFALGVLQALAAKGLLTRFQYLSMVSGGGYTGAWLTRWMADEARRSERTEGAAGAAYDNAAIVERKLAGSDGAGQPEQLRRLRERFNYFPHRIGLFSTDTLTRLAIRLRNIVINWIIFGPVLLIAALAPHLYSHLVAVVAMLPRGAASVCLAVGALTLWFSVHQTCRHLPSHADASARLDARGVFRLVTAPLLLCALFAPLALAPVVTRDAPEISAFRTGAFLAPCLAMIVGYVTAWAVVPAANRGHFFRNALVWIIVAAASTALLWQISARVLASTTKGWRNDVLTATGPPFVILSLVLLSMIYIAFRRTTRKESTSRRNPTGRHLLTDLDREWLARLSAFKIRLAMFWLILAFCVVLLPRWLGGSIEYTISLQTGSIAAIAGTLIFIGNRLPVTAAAAAVVNRIGLLRLGHLVAIAAIVLAGLLLMILSRFEVRLLELGELPREWTFVADAAVMFGIKRDDTGVVVSAAGHMVLLAILGGVTLLASGLININRFSRLGVDRSRLARTYLGNARSDRDADPFTDFDAFDNVRMHELAARAEGKRVLFPVFNVALNVARPSRSGQVRTTGSFVITPLACGSAFLDAEGAADPAGAYLPALNYAGNEADLGLSETGISLATAMALSGTAANPRFRYRSSPAISLLMTLLDLRLGAWLPNPARAADLKTKVQKSGPTSALRPLLAEAAGMADDGDRDIALSDGGDFESLGLYEMVRRRCRWIVVVDAVCDPECRLAELGNAMRRISVDLDAEIVFDRIDISSRTRPIERQSSFAIATIRYPETPEPGRLLYIKPSYFGDLPVDIRTYAEANEGFPHEPTFDRWFTEQQFESYRKLGEAQVSRMGKQRYPAGAGLPDFFEDARRQLSTPAFRRPSHPFRQART